MKFTQNERFIADAVSALLGIQQANRRERRKGKALEQAIDLFLRTTFGMVERKEGSDQFVVLPVQYRGLLEESAGASEEVLPGYGFDLEVGEEHANELDALLSTFTEADRGMGHFEINGIEATVIAAVAPELIALTGTPPTTQEVVEDYFKTAQRNMKGQCISLNGASEVPGSGSTLTPTTEIVYSISTQTEFGSYLAEEVDPCIWFQTSKFAPSTLQLEAKFITSEQWDSFMEFACALLLYFELIFGSYERIQICPVCKSLYFEERSGKKKYCNDNCASKSKSKKYQTIPCRKRQRTHFEHMYDSVNLKHGQCKKPRYPDADYCRDCDMDPSLIKGGQCKKLNEDNAELIQQKQVQKMDKKRIDCFDFNYDYRDKLGDRNLDLPAFSEGLCKDCDLPTPGRRTYCPKLIQGVLARNPTWKPPRTYEQK